MESFVMDEGAKWNPGSSSLPGPPPGTTDVSEAMENAIGLDWQMTAK